MNEEPVKEKRKYSKRKPKEQVELKEPIEQKMNQSKMTTK
jgi:hypothetical protein